MRMMVSIVLAGLALTTPRAQAGEAGIALSKCLTAAVSPTDKRALVRWIFSAMAVHPDIQDLAVVDATKRDEVERAGVDVFERLIAQDCTTQSREAIVKEGTAGFGDAFRTLGEVAMGGVVEDPQVQAAMTHLGERLDQQRILKALLAK